MIELKGKILHLFPTDRECYENSPHTNIWYIDEKYGKS